MITIRVQGDSEMAKRLTEETDVATLAVNVGDSQTLILHPASTTHQRLSEKAQREAGVTPDMVRLSIGLEDVEDIKYDLDRALERTSGP